MRIGYLVMSFVLLTPLAAVAQGPMTVEQVGSGWAATPEVKQTEVDHHAGTLLGGNAGWINEETFFIGGAGYWLVNGDHNRDLGYGGLLLQWIVRGSQPVGFAAKALMGGGTGTFTGTVTSYVPVPRPDPHAQDSRPILTPVTQQVPIHSDFFVFEPGVDAHIRFSNRARLTAGASYRFIGDYWSHYYYSPHGSDQLQGWAGTIGVTFGGGF